MTTEPIPDCLQSGLMPNSVAIDYYKQERYFPCHSAMFFRSFSIFAISGFHGSVILSVRQSTGCPNMVAKFATSTRHLRISTQITN